VQPRVTSDDKKLALLTRRAQSSAGQPAIAELSIDLIVAPDETGNLNEGKVGETKRGSRRKQTL